METTIQFRHMPPSDALGRRAEKLASKLGQFHSRLLACHVVIEAPHQHHHQGQQFEVKISLEMPGDDLHISHRPGDDQAHTDAYVALRDAFDALRRLLQDRVRKMQGKVKQHSVAAVPPSHSNGEEPEQE